MFQGFVQQEENLVLTLLVRDSSQAPRNLDALPTFRVYGPGGLMPSGTGTASFRDAGSVSGASNASPIVVASAGHGLSTGQLVTLAGVGGNTAANGTFSVTRVDGDTFSLDGSTGSGAYTSGGNWNTTGLYQVTVSALGSESYAAGSAYAVLFSGLLGGVAWADLHTFCVG